MRAQFFLFALLMLSGVVIGQHQITMALGDPFDITPTSFKYRIYVTNTGASVLKLAAVSPQVYYENSEMRELTSLAYAITSVGPAFKHLSQVHSDYNHETFRITQSPVSVDKSATLRPGSREEFATVMVSTRQGELPYPITLKLRTGIPNITLAAYVPETASHGNRYAKTTTSFAISKGNLVLGDDLTISYARDAADQAHSREILQMHAYPSPTDGILNVVFETENESIVMIRILDLTGRMVFEQKVQAHKGMNQSQLALASLIAGTYQVQIATPSAKSKSLMQFVKI